MIEEYNKHSDFVGLFISAINRMGVIDNSTIVYPDLLLGKGQLFSIGSLYHELGHHILLHFFYTKELERVFSKFLEVFNKSIKDNFYGKIDCSKNPNTSIIRSIPMSDEVRWSSVSSFDILETKFFLEILEESAYNVAYNKKFTIDVLYEIFANYYAMKVGYPIMKIDEPVKKLIFGNFLEKQIEEYINLSKYQIVINSSLYYSMPRKLRKRAYRILVNGLLKRVYKKFKYKVKKEVLNYYKFVMKNFKTPYESNNNPFRRAKQLQMSGLAFDIANAINEHKFYFLHSLGDNSGILKMKKILQSFGFVFLHTKEIKYIVKIPDRNIEELLRRLIVYIVNFPDLEKNRLGNGIVGSHLIFIVFDIFKDLTEEEFKKVEMIKKRYLLKYHKAVISKYIKYHRDNIDNILKEVEIIIENFIEPNKDRFRLRAINYGTFIDLISDFNSFIKSNNLKYIKNFYQFSFYHYLYFINKMAHIQKENFNFPKNTDFDENFMIYLKIIDYLAELTKAFYNEDNDKINELIKPNDSEEEASYFYEKYHNQLNMETALYIAYRRIIENNRIDAFLFLFNLGGYLNWVFNFSF